MVNVGQGLALGNGGNEQDRFPPYLQKCPSKACRLERSGNNRIWNPFPKRDLWRWNIPNPRPGQPSVRYFKSGPLDTSRPHHTDPIYRMHPRLFSHIQGILSNHSSLAQDDNGLCTSSYRPPGCIDCKSPWRSRHSGHIRCILHRVGFVYRHYGTDQ